MNVCVEQTLLEFTSIIFHLGENLVNRHKMLQTVNRKLGSFCCHKNEI